MSISLKGIKFSHHLNDIERIQLTKYLELLLEYNKKVNLISKEYIILTIIIIIAFVARLYRINNPIADWHSWRQADTSAVTRRYVSEGVNLLYPKYDDLSSIP